MIPHLFSKKSIPRRIPSMKKEILLLKKTKTKRECLKKAYDIITSKYRGGRVETYLRFHQLFMHDPQKLWKRKGFLHCTQQNYLLRVLLIKSGKFHDDDIQLKLTSIWGSPHQYLRVSLSERKSLDVDCWSKSFGTPLGKYMHGFN